MHNTREEFLNMSVKRKIICFGAGRFLKNIVDFLQAEHLNVDKLIDNAREKWGTQMEGVVIQSPNILKECDEDKYVVLISSKNYASEIKEQIEEDFSGKFAIFMWPLILQTEVEFSEKLWHERIYRACKNVYKEIAEKRIDAEDYLKEKEALLVDRKNVILPRTPLMITTRCTLRCKECSNLMPYYSVPKDYPADEVIQWIKNICEAVDEWVCCELVGGEPFLYRDLEKILTYVLYEAKIQRVEFTTNASVIPKLSVLKLLANDKVFIKISEYPGLIESEKLVHYLDKYGIHYSVMKSMRWSRTKNLEKRNRSYQELQSQYLNCGSAKMCRTILNGKLYVCSKAASLMELGYVNYLEIVDLTDTVHLRENIKEFLQLTFSYACDYCDIGSADEEMVEPAEQIAGK